MGGRPRLLATLALLAVGVAAACGDAKLAPQETPDPRLLPGAQEGAQIGRKIEGQVRTLVAESLRRPLGEIAAAFERANPQAKVDLQFGSTPDLTNRALQGEQADVLVADQPDSLQALADRDRVSDRVRNFTRTAEGKLYPLAILKPAPNLVAAQGFVGHILSIEGQRVLERHGFKRV